MRHVDEGYLWLSLNFNRAPQTCAATRITSIAVYTATLRPGAKDVKDFQQGGSSSRILLLKENSGTTLRPAYPSMEAPQRVEGGAL